MIDSARIATLLVSGYTSNYWSSAGLQQPRYHIPVDTSLLNYHRNIPI